jgi:hypothetical protein
MHVSGDDAEFTRNGIALLERVYVWLRQTYQKSKPLLQARHKTIHNFLLRHKQYYFTMQAQRIFRSMGTNT